MMKQLFISFGGGLLLLCLWGAIAVATSQDFAHEGPNSVWFSPVDAWGRVLFDIGWSRWVSSLSPLPKYLFGITMLLGPFVFALSVAVHLAARLLRKMTAAGKLR
ncbi:MAG: hypothetical protein ACJ741_07370 [Pyrinomonadaceae bacterium]